jgi:transcriptional regulator with XRE-family HTH domain
MAKSSEKIEAKRLRKSGFSIKNIAKKLNVSSSSVSLWTRDIILTQDQYEVLEGHAKDPFYGKRLDYINKIKTDTNTKIEKLKFEGINEIGTITKRELFLIGSALYWSEGFKKDSQVGFANSDPTMINLFLRWLFECFEYKIDDLAVRITLNISHKHRITEIGKHWSKITKIPIDKFRKPFFQNVKWQKVYDNPDEYFGLLRVKVLKSKDFLRKIHGYIEGLRLQADV